MATGKTFESRVRLVFEAVGGKQVEKQIQGLLTKSGEFDKRMGKKKTNLADNLGVSEQALDQMKNFTKETEVQKAAFKETRQEAKRFKGEYLGIMFAGMSLQRVFGGMTKKLLGNYREMLGEGVTPLSEGLTRLEASFKFLQFSIVEAAGPLILRFTDMLSGMAESLAKADPKTLTTIFGAIAGLAGIGSIMSVFGQGAIFFSSIASAQASKETVRALQETANLKESTLKSGTSFFNSFAKAAGVGGIALGLVNAFEAMDDVQEGAFVDAAFNAASSALTTAGGIQLLRKGKGGGWMLGVGIALDLAENEILGKTTAGFLASITGMLGGIKAVLRKGVAEMRETVRVAIGDNKLLNWLFLGPAGVVGMERDAELSGMSIVEAFGDGFEKGFNRIYDGGKVLDEGIANVKAGESFFSLPELPQTEQAFGSLTTTLTNLNADSQTWANTVSAVGNETLAKELPKQVETFILDKEGGLEALKIQTHNWNTQLDQAFRDRTINVTVKYKEENKPSGVRVKGPGNSSSVNANI